MVDKRQTRQARNATASSSISSGFRNLPAFFLNLLSREWLVAWFGVFNSCPGRSDKFGASRSCSLRSSPRETAFRTNTIRSPLGVCLRVCTYVCMCVPDVGENWWFGARSSRQASVWRCAKKVYLVRVYAYQCSSSYITVVYYSSFILFAVFCRDEAKRLGMTSSKLS